MKIAQIAPLSVSVPPKRYGGTELVVSLLTEELVARGHEVTLFASGDSVTKAELDALFPEALGVGRFFSGKMDFSFDIAHIHHAYRRHREFDVIHNHAGVLGLSFADFVAPPVITTLHNDYILPGTLQFSEFKHCFFVAISEKQRSNLSGLNFLGVAYNAIELKNFPLVEKKEDYLLYLGNITPQKGVDIAVRAAKALNERMILAGKIDPGVNQEYFENEVKPLIDGKLITFEGEVTPERKIELYSKARAFLLPIRWEEPFGLVMIESMACGTPVIAYGHGSVPEVVKNGETGFVVNDFNSLLEAIKKVSEISPLQCRKWVEERFSVSRMTDDYLNFYQKAIELKGGK